MSWIPIMILAILALGCLAGEAGEDGDGDLPL
jgi:hypothetical protein